MDEAEPRWPPDARCAEMDSRMTDNSPDNSGFDFPLVAEGVDRVPTQFRALYQQSENGELRLAPEIAKKFDFSNLQIALQKERTRARENERVAKESERKLSAVANTIGAASVDELAARAEELVGRASPSAVDAMRVEVAETFKRTYGAQLQQKEAEAAKLRKTLQITLIDGEATRAIADAKGSTRALLPHVTGSMRLIEEDGELKPRVVDGRGEVRYSSEGLPMTAADLIGELRRDADFAGLFASSGNTGTGARGAGGSGGTGGKGTKSYSRSDWRNLMARADKGPQGRGCSWWPRSADERLRRREGDD